MSRKRDKPSPSSRHQYVTARISKRRRPLPQPRQDDAVLDQPTYKPPAPPALVVMGLPGDCSVLDLKSRFEIYGSISRIRIDRDGVGYVAYRTVESAEAAVTASLDPSFGITVDSKKVKVIWATDPMAQWREGVASRKEKTMPSVSSSSSKLLRAEAPLRRHGRGNNNKLASTIINPTSDTVSSSSVAETPFKGREIVAYDDIL